MGVDMYWGARKIGKWSDGEWDRLKKVKAGEYVPSIDSTTSVSAHISRELYEKAQAYAVGHGTTLSQVIREMLYILTCSADRGAQDDGI